MMRQRMAFSKKQRLQDLLEINERLKKYEEEIWPLLDGMIQLKPMEMEFIWDWRLEQEHAMKARNGGKGMSDDQVKSFISRYMPSYELFMSSMNSGWAGRGLRVLIDKKRRAVAHEQFE